MNSRRRVLRDIPRLLSYPSGARERIVAFQEERLRQLIAHAYENVPYYRRLFDDARLKPADIRGLGDLGRIPLTTKATLRALGGSEMLSQDVDPASLIARETNGSTGIPVTVRRTRVEQILPTLFLWRVRRELGLRRGLRVTALTKGVGHAADSRRLVRNALVHAGGITRWTRVDMQLPIEEVASRVKESDPEVLMGYAGVLSRVARHLASLRIEVRPKMVLSGAEVLTPTMRSTIETVFKAPVRDTYSSYELGLIAWECLLGGTYHVCDDNVIVEVLGSDSNPAPSGELIGTSLHFAAVPMIRYQLGDIVTRGPDRCSCGSPFSTLSAIHGRMNDYFPLPDGRVLHPYRIGTAVYPAAFEWMNQYQVVQEKLDRVMMRIVPVRQPSAEDIAALTRAVEEVLGTGIDFVVELVDDLHEERNGKFQIYKSLVESEYSGT